MSGPVVAVWSYEYCIYPGGPSGDSSVESRRIPRYMAHCHHNYASGEDPEYWRSFLNDRELSDARLPEILEYTQLTDTNISPMTECRSGKRIRLRLTTGQRQRLRRGAQLLRLDRPV
ncbi:hypothetical protein JCGZ_03945 [Jatropha curcas]|uniref:Uncharacterized protein n=1 Tax=Jatropha curcas TaxID=180498 RepID=A0A067JA74_JATCU|nr:hypothetical protein JCGZ_03945 [Jatropha curcas]